MYRLLFLSFLLLAACKDSPTGPQTESGIHFGQSIEGIRIGDDAASVVNKLGQPNDHAYGDFMGEIYLYTEGRYAGMSIMISQDNALGLGVINVAVEAPYTGKSKDGVGIGSSREEAVKILGQPTSTQNEDIYNYQSNSFLISYRDGRVSGITMGRRKIIN